MILQEQRLADVDPRLVDLVKTVSMLFPSIMVVCGYRGKAEQDKAFAEGKSKVKWPNGKHNKRPSLAVDLAIVRAGKIDWSSKTDFAALGGAMLMAAKLKGLDLRWGGDFNGNRDFKDDGFVDSPHFELSA